MYKYGFNLWICTKGAFICTILMHFLCSFEAKSRTGFKVRRRRIFPHYYLLFSTFRLNIKTSKAKQVKLQCLNWNLTEGAVPTKHNDIILRRSHPISQKVKTLRRYLFVVVDQNQGDQLIAKALLSRKKCI